MTLARAAARMIQNLFPPSLKWAAAAEPAAVHPRGGRRHHGWLR